MSQNLSDDDLFSVLGDALGSAGVAHSPAELHGVVCGLLAGGVRPAESELQGVLAAHTDLAGGWPASLAAPFVALKDQALASLEGEGLELALLLPPDQEDLGLRVAALGQWCDGFLAGFGTASAGMRDEELSPALQESLSDLSAISQVGTPDDEGEEEEAMLEQVAEHARMAAIMVFTELALRQRRADDAQGKGETPTQH